MFIQDILLLLNRLTNLLEANRSWPNIPKNYLIWLMQENLKKCTNFILVICWPCENTYAHCSRSGTWPICQFQFSTHVKAFQFTSTVCKLKLGSKRTLFCFLAKYKRITKSLFTLPPPEVSFLSLMISREAFRARSLKTKLMG